MTLMFRSLWNYRHFVISSIYNELITRFSRSKIGGLWMIISPLIQVAIYALVLSNVLAAKLPGVENTDSYSVYLMAGLLAWNLFSEIVGRCLTLFIEQGNLMKKMSFPRITLPVIVAGSCLINNFLLFIAMIGVFILLGHHFNIVTFFLVPLTLVVVIFALGVGLILGIMNVFLRDIGQVVPIFLQMLFWFTPIIYPVSIIPEEYQNWLKFNPMYQITDAYQSILVYGVPPKLESVFVITSISLLSASLSLFLFRRASAEMVDSL